MSKSLGQWCSVFLALFLTGCLDQGSSTVAEGGTEIDVIDPAKVICSPLDDYTPTFLSRGLKGKLYYLTDDQPRYSTVDEFIPNAHVVDADLYFNRLNIPTRPWDRGFYTMDGQQVLNPDGLPFYEYFGVELETQLKLSPGEPEGDYQLAVLADDGAMIRLHDAGGDQVIVDDDGVHPTKMGCATQSIHLTANSRIPVQVRYHQGPRYHISLVVMWRPMPANPGDVTDSLCDQMGNDLYFDSTTTPPTPQTAYYDLLSRGWKVLEGTNFALPESAQNPCVLQEDPLEITNLAISSITQSSMVLTWTTNLPASSQVQYKVVASGATTLTTENTSLTTSHSVTLTGLSSNTLYAVKALSTSQSLQTAQSDERAVRTQR